MSLTGGTITQADLNDYSRVKGQPQRVRLENHDSPETLYLLQVALCRPRGHASVPIQLATFTSTQSDFQMAPGQDELRVPLHWTDGQGVEVTKEFVFHRGSYAINVTQTVNNHSAAPWAVSALCADPAQRSAHPYLALQHQPGALRHARPGHLGRPKYRKLKITDDDDKHLNDDREDRLDRRPSASVRDRRGAAAECRLPLHAESPRTMSTCWPPPAPR